ncbi:MAG: hypothetical protein HY080_17615 [Gammaproteobacteria bacterium]|nr:hypothetical protein [Gammaproteobacteria bacterium]
MKHTSSKKIRHGFENRSQPPLSPRAFRIRLGKYTLAALLLVAVVLYSGMLGYHYLEALNWIDAFLNASMILGGMGPVNELKTTAGKLFAGLYALFSGLIFLVVAGLVFGPLLHRLMHKFHFDTEMDNDN